MPPSATEQVVPIAPERVDPVKLEKARGTNGPSVERPTALPWQKDLPKFEVNHKEPLKLSGALDKFESFDVTPVIGREFANVDLVEWLNAPDSDELLRDLAITSEITPYAHDIIHTLCPNSTSQPIHPPPPLGRTPSSRLTV